jgi:hypothetical protein
MQLTKLMISSMLLNLGVFRSSTMVHTRLFQGSHQSKAGYVWRACSSPRIYSQSLPTALYFPCILYAFEALSYTTLWLTVH